MSDDIENTVPDVVVRFIDSNRECPVCGSTVQRIQHKQGEGVEYEGECGLHVYNRPASLDPSFTDPGRHSFDSLIEQAE